MGTFHADVFPVNRDQPTLPGDHGQVSTALVISGGGSRSMTVTFGALRGLESLGLMGGLDAVSSASGGTWAAAIYMFVDLPSKELLGEVTMPHQLTMDVLRRSPAALGKAATVPVTPIMIGLMTRSFLDFPKEQLWVSTISKAVLGEFGLDDMDTYMANSVEDVARIKSRNPQLRDRRFLTPVPGRPKTFVMGATLVAPTGYLGDRDNVVSLQISPDYTGSPFYPDNSLVKYTPQSTQSFHNLYGVQVGGGFVETFAFGGRQPPKHQNGGLGVAMPSPIQPMSLAKAIGVSSHGIASAMTQLPGKLNLQKLGEIANVWPVTSRAFGLHSEAFTYVLGDGGNIDNSGLLPMLQRRADRIIWLVNTDIPLNLDVDFCAVSQLTSEITDGLEDMLKANFGFVTVDSVGQFLGKNQVFKREDLAPLLCELKKLREDGAPTIVLRRLQILRNAWWSIESYEATIVVVYAEQCDNFERQLPPDTAKELANSRSDGIGGEFQRYPHYMVVLQNPPEFSALTAAQVNLLAAQTEYAVRENAGLFQELLGVVGAAGAAAAGPPAAAEPAEDTAAAALAAAPGAAARPPLLPPPGGAAVGGGGRLLLGCLGGVVSVLVGAAAWRRRSEVAISVEPLIASGPS